MPAPGPEPEIPEGSDVPALKAPAGALAAAHLLPLYGDYTGSRTPVQFYVNRRGEAVTCDFFDATTAPHTIVSGKSRSGKSFLVNHLIQQTLPLGSSVVILDRWASYDTTCEVYKGEYVQVDLDEPMCFNPFAGDLGSSHRTFLMAVIDQMASGVSGQDCGRPGADRQGGMQPGIAGVCRMARKRAARAGTAAQGLLRSAAASAL